MLKNTFITSIKQLLTSRYLTVLSLALVLLSIAFVIYIALTVRPSELQLVTHYTAFGVTHLYRDQWWYLLSFAVFGVFVAFLHVAIATKILMVRGRSLAIFYAWMGIGIILLAWITSYSLIFIWKP